jgi:hypothetical protein
MTDEVDEMSAASRGSHVVGRTVTEEDMTEKPVAKSQKLLHEVTARELDAVATAVKELSHVHLGTKGNDAAETLRRLLLRVADAERSAMERESLEWAARAAAAWTNEACASPSTLTEVALSDRNARRYSDTLRGLRERLK